MTFTISLCKIKIINEFNRSWKWINTGLKIKAKDEIEAEDKASKILNVSRNLLIANQI